MTLRATTGPVVLVTGVGGGAVGHELLQALRLAPTAYRIIAADASAESFGLTEGDERATLPPAAAIGYLDALRSVCRRFGVQALLPGSEPELRVVSAHRQVLADEGVVLLANSEEVIDVGLDKAATVAALQRAGLDAPRSVLAEDSDALQKVDWFPCVVKPVRGGSGSSTVFIARNRNELGFFAEYVRSSGYVPIVQEYVGNPEQEYTVGVLSTLGGALVGSLAMRRVLRGLSLKSRVPAPGGPGEWLALSSGLSQGRIERASEIRQVCERIAIELGSRGPLNIQLRVSQGRLYPFEINPRFSGTCCLRALAGFNEADILLRHHLLGEPIGQVVYHEGLAIRALRNRFIPDRDGIR